MVTHDPDIAQQADRRIELVHGHLAVDQRISMDDGIHFDHLLEQIWVCGEEGKPADVEHIRTPGGVDPVRTLARMEDLRLVNVQEDHEIAADRAREEPRARRGAAAPAGGTPCSRTRSGLTTTKRTRKPANSSTSSARNSTSASARFLGHPTTCPHGNPIPPGDCCNHKKDHD